MSVKCWMCSALLTSELRLIEPKGIWLSRIAVEAVPWSFSYSLFCPSLLSSVSRTLDLWGWLLATVTGQWLMASSPSCHGLMQAFARPSLQGTSKIYRGFVSYFSFQIYPFRINKLNHFFAMLLATQFPILSAFEFLISWTSVYLRERMEWKFHESVCGKGLPGSFLIFCFLFLETGWGLINCGTVNELRTQHGETLWCNSVSRW